jgi:hypothetical protein
MKTSSELPGVKCYKMFLALMMMLKNAGEFVLGMFISIFKYFLVRLEAYLYGAPLQWVSSFM